MPQMTATKAHAAAGGGSVGGALAALAIYGLDLDPSIELPLAVVITAGASWIGAYLGPPNREKHKPLA